MKNLNCSTILQVSPGQKDEGLVINNENNVVTLKLKKLGSIVEIDYSNEIIFEKKFIDFFKRLTEDDRVYVRILRFKGKIVKVLPSEMFLTYELQASVKIVQQLKVFVSNLTKTLKSKDVAKTPSEDFIRLEIRHAVNNIEKFTKRMRVAKRLLERYKAPKMKRSYKKTVNKHYRKKSA